MVLTTPAADLAVAPDGRPGGRPGPDLASLDGCTVTVEGYAASVVLLVTGEPIRHDPDGAD